MYKPQICSVCVCVCAQVKLVQHTYSCLFGTFLCNSGKEREDRRVQERTCSVWSLLRPAHRSLRNMLYSSHSENVRAPSSPPPPPPSGTTDSFFLLMVSVFCRFFTLCVTSGT